MHYLKPMDHSQVADPQPAAPICAACAAGHHDQPLLPHESCTCPCHGIQAQCIGVAA